MQGDTDANGQVQGRFLGWPGLHSYTTFFKNRDN